MKICYYGTYDKEYTRSKINIQGLRNNGAEVIECHCSKPKFITKNNFTKILFYLLFPLSLTSRNIILLIKGFYLFLRFRYEIIIVGDSSHFEVLGAFILGKLLNKKVIFDPLLSLYSTYINEFDVYQNKLIKSLLKNTEKVIYKLPDLILVHTSQDIIFFHNLYNIPLNKLEVLYLGAEDLDILKVNKAKHKSFTVAYSGVFIPLHGVEYILGAAKLALKQKDIRFIFTGTGLGFSKAVSTAKKEKLGNVEFLGWLSKEKMGTVLHDADLILGIFKNDVTLPRCIPNKVFQSISFGKPTITAKAPAISELFTHKKDIYLCEPSNSLSLYKAIIYLKQHPQLAKSIAKAGKTIYDKEFNPSGIGRKLLSICERNTHSRPWNTHKVGRDTSVNNMIYRRN